MEQKEKKYNQIEEVAGILLLAFILLVLSYQVVMRFVFHNTNSWSEELSRYMFVWFIYITVCFAIYRNAHIKIDAFIGLYPKRLRPYVKLFGNLIFFLYAIGVTYYGADYVHDIWMSGQISLGLGVKMAYMYAAIPVCHAIMAIRLVQLSYKMLKYPEQYAD